MNTKPILAKKAQTSWTEILGVSRTFAMSVAAVSGLAVVLAIFWCFHSAPPRTVTLTSGPPGSIFQVNAEKYAKILKRSGVTLRILPSEGSVENLKRLADPALHVNVGFVQGGDTLPVRTDTLVSLGGLYNEPLLVFYRGNKKGDLLSLFAGQRIAIGPPGSGTQALARIVLAANGIPASSQLLELDADDAAKALMDGKIEAAFMMGDSASSSVLRELLHQPQIHLFNFVQADAYTRRFTHLNKLELPRGSIDLGKDIPPEDVYLLGPTVELIARQDLNPVISDLLLDAARQVHSGAGMFRRQGEFPSPQEHEIRLSNDALRFYKSGKSFFYRYLPFSLASLVDRLVVIIVPLMVVLVPSIKFIISAYRMRINFVINRWYRALLIIEQDILSGMTPEVRSHVMARLEHIEKMVNKMKVPASFAGQFYELRGHIGFVRNQIKPD